MFNRDKLIAYAELVRLNRPIGIYLLLWPTLWALLIAGDGYPDMIVTLVFIAGVVLMRSAGCAINDFADRDFDGHVKRTKQRPIVTGKVSPKEALGVFIALSLIAFILAVIFLNTLTLLFAIAAVALAASYPFTKRLHYLPQVHLGLAFAWAVPMAFVALTNTFPPTVCWLLLTTTLLWTTAYDTIYGMVDREDDIKIGVKSTAILFGDADKIVIGLLQAGTIFSLVSIGLQIEMRYWYFIGIALAAILFLYQQYLIRNRIPANCLKGFLNNNYVGLIIFLGVAASYWLPI